MDYFRSYPQLLGFLETFFREKKLARASLSPELCEKTLPELVYFLDAVLKAENFYLKKNVELRNDQPEPYLNARLSKTVMNALAFFNYFRSSFILISDSERQTFRFILENLADYLQQDEAIANKELFLRYKFWIDNFFRFFDLLLSKLREQQEQFLELPEKSPSGLGEICLNSGKIRLKLTPFVVLKRQQPLFLVNIGSDNLTYLNPKSREELSVANPLFFEKTLIFLMANLDVLGYPGLSKIDKSALQSREIDLNWRLIQKIYREYLSGQSYESSLNLLEQLHVRRLPFPQLQLLAMKALYHLGRFQVLKEFADSFQAQFPYYYQSHELLGDAARQERDWEKAVYHYEQSLNVFFTTVVSEKAKSAREQLAQKRRIPEISRSENFYLIEGREGELFDRPRELGQLLEILISQQKANVLVIGDKGVGKSSLLRILAREIGAARVPPALQGKQLQEINFVSLLSGAKYRGQFEEKVVKLLQDFSQTGNILVLEDIHLMMSGAAARSGTSLDFTEILKGFLKRNSFAVIATTSYEEYKNSLERDNALIGFFQKVVLGEMTPDSCREILLARLREYQKKENIVVREDVLEKILESSRRDIRDRKLPDSAILVQERSIAKARLAAFRAHRTEIVVDEETVSEVISDLLNLKEHSLALTMRQRLLELSPTLKKFIIGQDEAIERVSGVVAAGKLGYNIKKERPEAIFLFVGPTGVGKTELAISLARALFGSSDYLLRIDMSEYMEKFTYSRFIGSAPGYVGYYDSNQLTDKIRQNPYLIILLDEIEKADPQILNIFLQVLDAGRLTDSRGNVVDFSRTVIIMTSNIGTSLFSHQAMGYLQQHGAAASRPVLIKALKKYFSPEFLNRIDEIVVFKPLGRESLAGIVRQQLAIAQGDLRRQGKQLFCGEDVVGHIVEGSDTKDYGAREISRLIKKEVLEKAAALSFHPEWEQAAAIIAELNSRGEVELTLEKEEALLSGKYFSQAGEK